MSLSSKLKKKIKRRLKKQHSKNKAFGTNSNRNKPRQSKPDSPLRKIDGDRPTLTPADRQTIIRDLDNDIKTAQTLPPADASKFLRAAHALKKGLLDLDARKKGNNDSNDPDKDKTKNKANPTDLKKARDELTRAQATLQQPVTAVRESAIATATALKKKPADMTAEDISDAITAVEQAIADGQTNLLPADASRWQRAMYALKLALFELGGVDPQLAVTDKATLEDLIKTQQGNAPADPATPAKVRQAIADANQVQADIAPQIPARSPQPPPPTSRPRKTQKQTARGHDRRRHCSGDRRRRRRHRSGRN